MKLVIDQCLTHPKKIASVNPVWSNIIGVTAQHKPISRYCRPTKHSQLVSKITFC